MFRFVGVDHPRFLSESAVLEWCGLPNANNTVRNRLSRVSTFLRWCVRQGAADPALVEVLASRDNPLRQIPVEGAGAERNVIRAAPLRPAARARMRNSVWVSSADLDGVAGVLRALADAEAAFYVLRRHATSAPPDAEPLVKLDLFTNVNDPASTANLSLEVRLPDGALATWDLRVWTGPDVVVVTGHVQHSRPDGPVLGWHVDGPLFSAEEEATEADAAAKLIRSMASQVCAERRPLRH